MTTEKHTLDIAWDGTEKFQMQGTALLARPSVINALIATRLPSETTEDEFVSQSEAAEASGPFTLHISAEVENNKLVRLSVVCDEQDVPLLLGRLIMVSLSMTTNHDEIDATISEQLKNI